MITFGWFLIGRLITNQLLYQLSYEGAKSFLIENIKLSKPNKGLACFSTFKIFFITVLFQVKVAKSDLL